MDSGPSDSYSENLVRAFIVRDWNTVRGPVRGQMKPLPEPAGLTPGPDGNFYCSGADEVPEPVQRMVIKDPTAYDAAGVVEVAYVCPEHGAYWYAFETPGNTLNAVYGPFRMSR